MAFRGVLLHQQRLFDRRFYARLGFFGFCSFTITRMQKWGPHTPPLLLHCLIICILLGYFLIPQEKVAGIEKRRKAKKGRKDESSGLFL